MRYLIVLLLIFSSCKSLRTVSKEKEEDESKEKTESITVRPSEVAVFEIPRVTYKDTTITTISRENVVIKAEYDSVGRVQTIYCIPPEILEYLKQEKQDKSEDFTKETTNSFRTLDGFYILAILAVFFILLIKLPNFNR